MKKAYMLFKNKLYIDINTKICLLYIINLHNLKYYMYRNNLTLQWYIYLIIKFYITLMPT